MTPPPTTRPPHPQPPPPRPTPLPPPPHCPHTGAPRGLHRGVGDNRQQLPSEGVTEVAAMEVLEGAEASDLDFMEEV